MKILDRQVVSGHDGRSGAVIETGRLDDWTRVYVKRSPVDGDLAGLLTGTALRERDLLEAGVFDRLPAGVASALLSVEVRDGEVVTISRAVDHAILTWDRILTGAEVRTIFDRISAVHRAFAGRAPAGLCPLETRVGLFGPSGLAAVAAANPELHAAMVRGRELFDDLVPAEVAAAVAHHLDAPGSLAAAMGKAGTTLVHGDFWLVNLALDGDTLIPLDWGLATDGPPALDLLLFCAGAMSNVAMTRTELLDAARAACGDGTDQVFAATAVWVLMEVGWNKALDAVDHPDPAKRATQRADLDFWVRRARTALDAGAVG